MNFGNFNSVFIRPSIHVVGDILTVTPSEMQQAFEGNMTTNPTNLHHT
jgi:hypothetical protein